MSIIVKWGNPEHTIIHVIFPYQWSWDDYMTIDEKVSKMLSTVNHKVCYLADIEQTKRLPSGARLDIVRHVLDFHNPNSDLLVIVGMNPAIQKLFRIVTLALGRIGTRIELVDEINEGYDVINRRLRELNQVHR